MSLSASRIRELAALLDQSLLEVRERERLTLVEPDLSLPDAYHIQDQGVLLRFGRGERLVGLKMGLTSEAKRQQMNLKSPCYGVLTDRMLIQDGATFSLAKSIHPKIEPEIAFLVAREIRGVPTPKEALAACSGVVAAMEILDSRYAGFKYFSLPDVIADNSSSAFFVVGRQVFDPQSSDWLDLKMTMEIDGKVAQEGLSTAISDGPVNSIVQLCELLKERGLTLPAGTIVLAGAATLAVPLEAGTEVRLTIEKLGSVSVHIGRT